MRFGSPLSPGATKVMLLGAGELGKEVIIAFQRLGVEVIAVDWGRGFQPYRSNATELRDSNRE